MKTVLRRKENRLEKGNRLKERGNVSSKKENLIKKGKSSSGKRKTVLSDKGNHLK